MKNRLVAPYGRINMDTLKRNDITFLQKLIYAVIAIKQGESDFAKLTNKMIADAVGCTARYVSESITKMEKLKMLSRINRGKVQAIQKKGQYGMVELAMLITTNISPTAKYLYLIYCAVGNDYDANIWGREKVCSEFHISHSTYYLAHKELEENKILEITGRSSGNGIQTSNINIIIRTEDWRIMRPLSWVPPEAFDLNKWCLKHYEPEQRMQPKTANSDSSTGTEDATQQERRMQRTLTINNNPNSTAISSNLEQTNEVFSNHTSETPEIELNIEVLEEAFKKKFKSPEQAKETIDTLNESGFDGVAKPELTDEMIKKAFKAFAYFKEAVESYGQETFGYALNLDDLNRFCRSSLSSGYSDEEIEYHIGRVAELGFEKLNKAYIGFSYVIQTNGGVKQAQF